MKVAVHLISALAMAICGHVLLGQQQAKTWVNPDGSKETLDAGSGMTETRKDGTIVRVTAADLDASCKGFEKWTVLAGGSDGRAFASLCETWAELKPKTQIESVSFLTLITRLLVLSQPGTTFERYRGLTLKSDAGSITYDAIIVPSDLGHEPSCTIEEENKPLEGTLYTYQCSVKTSSFADATRIKDELVQTLKSLNLTEDQVREHGLSAHARDVGLCAPTGECALEHVYATALRDGKILQIEANPNFTRDVRAGISAPINGIASDSGTLSFEVFSLEPAKSGNVRSVTTGPSL